MQQLARDLIRSAPPDRLFHYTGQTGLFGILKSSSIWASKIQCLNDSTEFVHGCQLACEALRKSAPSDAPEIRQFLSLADDCVSRMQNINVCVCCWSANGDLLSQWRAYARDQQGYSISISGAGLSNAGHRSGFTLGKCIYSRIEQEAVVEEIASEIWRKFSAMSDPPVKADLERLGSIFMSNLCEVVPFLKHGSFSEEAEWRLASAPLAYTAAEFDVRTGPVFPIPYYRLSLAWPGGGVGPLEFVVGPGVSQERASEAIHVLLKNSKLERQSVRLSRSPLRFV